MHPARIWMVYFVAAFAERTVQYLLACFLCAVRKLIVFYCIFTLHTNNIINIVQLDCEIWYLFCYQEVTKILCYSGH
jgi:hypothetical protein